jgi:hypothetical protein
VLSGCDPQESPTTALAPPVPGLIRCEPASREPIEVTRAVSAVAGLPGWLGASLTSHRNSNGADYPIDVRWNRENSPVTATLLMLVGGNSGAFYRDAGAPTGPNAAGLQDGLSASHGIRTIEIRFAPPNGSQVSPANGLQAISGTLADAVGWLVTQGVAAGPIIAYGNSGGACLFASAIAHHGLDGVLAGAVLGGGPFFLDTAALCAPGSGLSAQLRASIDAQCYEGIGTPCQQARLDPDPPYDCVSVLGQYARTRLPRLRISVLVGTTDGNAAFIVPQAQQYLSTIHAGRGETFERPAAPHQILASPAGVAAVRRRVLEVLQ